MIYFIGFIPVICFHPKTMINFKQASQYKRNHLLVKKDRSTLSILKVLRLPHDSQEPFVRFPPHCFAHNVPNQSVILTKYHMVRFKRTVKFAIRWYLDAKIGELFYDPGNHSSIHFLVDSPNHNEFIDCNGLEVDVIGLKSKWINFVR